jgi:hypothetical protein
MTDPMTTQQLRDLSWDEAKAAGLKTKTAWSQAGRSLARDAKPAALHHGWYDSYCLYDVSQTRPKRISKKPPEIIDLLAAIFTVTRSAKRYRNSAQTCYQYGKHGFASNFRKQKEHLYQLKDDGLVAAVRNGRVQAVGTHGRLTVYRGEGYCFHSLLRPKGAVLPEVGNNPLTVEAKPKATDEPRLKDAVYTLEELKVSAADAVATGEFERYSFPARERVLRHRHEDDDYDEEEYE